MSCIEKHQRFINIYIENNNSLNFINKQDNLM